MSIKATARRAIDGADPGDQGSIFVMLGQYNQVIQAALDKDDGGDTYRDIFWDTIDDVNELVTAPATISETDWGFLEELWNAYPATDHDHHLHTPMVNAIGAGVLNTRFTTGIEDAPVGACEYLLDVGRTYPADTAWEDASAVGWFADHPDADFKTQLLELVEPEELFVHSTLRTAFHADQEVAAEILKAYVEHPESVETLMVFETVESISNPNIPRAPRAHQPCDHYSLDSSVDDAVLEDLQEFGEELGYEQAFEHHGFTLMTS